MFDRSAPPKPEKHLSFNLPAIHNFKLNSGSEIFFIKKDNLPIIYTEFIISSGSKYDPNGKNGLNYLMSLLIDEGAGEYDALHLSDEFEKLGTVFSISSDHDKTVLSILSLKDHFLRSLELVSKIIFQPRFEEKDFLREKKKTIDKILQLKDEPSFLASTAFEKRVFNNTFYESPEIGFDYTLNAINKDDVKDFYEKYFLKAVSNIIVVGNINENEVAEAFNNYFNAWKPVSNKVTQYVQPNLSEVKYFFVDKKDSAQSEIRIGHIAKKRNAEDHFAARIMNTILGGQFSSRINLNLRERKGFTYGAGSAFHYYVDSAMFQVSTAVNIENTGESITEILKELDGIQKEITSTEIEFAKSYLVKQFPARFETFPQIAKNIESLIVHSLPLNELKNYITKIENTTSDEIRNAAKENILQNNMIILAVGDKKKILPQLKDITDGPPAELDIYGNILE